MKTNGIFACIIIVLTKDNSFTSTHNVNTTTISLNSANNFDISPYKEGYMIARDGRIAAYNTNQELQWEVVGSKTIPTIKTNGKYSLTYYNEDTLAVVANGKAKTNIKTKGKVGYGHINKKRSSVLFIEESSLLSLIVILSSATVLPPVKVVSGVPVIWP